MGIDDLKVDAQEMTRWQKHRFLLMIAGTIVISLGLVIVAMELYNSSGAAQLDLSRPAFQAIRQNAVQETNSNGYPATGTLDKAALEAFSKQYASRASNVIGVDGFDPVALSDDSLQVFTGPISGQ